MSILATWWFNIILYLILAVTYNQVFKVCTKTVKKDGAFIVGVEFFAGVFLLALIPFFGMQFPTDAKVYIFLGISCVFYAITDRLNTTARRGLEVSTFSIIKQVSTVFVITWGLLIFKEPFVWNKLLGATLIIFSNVLILYKKGKFKFNSYVIYELIACLSASIANCIDIGISGQFNLPIYISITLIIPAILIFFVERIKLKEVKEELVRGNKKMMTIVAIVWGLMLVTQLRAYQFGTVTTVAPLLALTVILNVIAGYVFLKERGNLWKKIFAAILIIVSVFLVKL